MKPKVLITCEHADFRIPDFAKSKIPDEYQPNKLKANHESYDKHALEISRLVKDNLLACGLKTDLLFYPFTRLILDANRTESNKNFYSKVSKFLNKSELTKIKQTYNFYLKSCNSWVEKNLKKGPVFIFSIHTFSPIYKDKKRRTDIGILFRNSISKELQLAQKIQKKLKNNHSDIKVHRNLPYRGHTDCLLNSILDCYKKNQNVNGIFFEFNQNYLDKDIKLKAELVSQSLLASIVEHS